MDGGVAARLLLDPAPAITAPTTDCGLGVCYALPQVPNSQRLSLHAAKGFRIYGAVLSRPRGLLQRDALPRGWSSVPPPTISTSMGNPQPYRGPSL